MLWDGASLGEWVHALDGADVVINLAGRNVNCRYNAENRRQIMDSRVNSVRAIAKAIAECSSPPPIWLQASTATIYAHRFDAPNDEFSGLIGGNEPDAPDKWRFSIEVAKAWEQELDLANVPQTRKVKMRSAMIMSPDPGGIFATLLGLVRFGLGGRAASGRQFISWIHYRDFVRAINWIIEHPDLDGVVNIASPNPLPQADFMRALRKAWGTPIGLPATKWMLEIGALFLNTETELILKSRRVIPSKLLQQGFRFEFPDWEEAARDLCTAWRTR